MPAVAAFALSGAAVVVLFRFKPHWNAYLGTIGAAALASWQFIEFLSLTELISAKGIDAVSFSLCVFGTLVLLVFLAVSRRESIPQTQRFLGFDLAAARRQGLVALFAGCLLAVWQLFQAKAGAHITTWVIGNSSFPPIFLLGALLTLGGGTLLFWDDQVLRRTWSTMRQALHHYGFPRVLGVSACALALLGIFCGTYFYYTGPSSAIERGDKNFFIVVAVLSGVMLVVSRWKRWIAALAVPFLIFALYLLSSYPIAAESEYWIP